MTLDNATGNLRAFAFAHGTALDSAQRIVTNGLDFNVARQMSTGGAGNRPGYFHTIELGPPDNPGIGMQLAYDMGLRHTSTPVVLILLLPEGVYDALQAQGLVLIEPMPGLIEQAQTVFVPPSFPEVNRHALWQIIDPFGR